MANIIEYIKKIWKYGDRVTPTDLNNIETGIKNNNDAISVLNSDLDKKIGIIRTEISIGTIYAGETRYLDSKDLKDKMPSNGKLISVSAYSSWTDTVYAITNLINDKEFYLWCKNVKSFDAPDQTIVITASYIL